ncbi:MAG: NAD(P) transhydrogenase subunit alpha [Thermoplasmatales archaeon]
MKLPISIGVLKESSEDENRVALVPDEAKRLISRQMQVLVQSGAGSKAGFQDSEYASAGCILKNNRVDVLSGSDIIVMLGRPEPKDLVSIREKAAIIGQIYPMRYQSLVEEMAKKGLRVYSLELLPRTTRAQSMDVLSSQSAVAGYRASIIGAYNLPRLMPMLTTAAGTVKPANVLVIGAGVAGLMAIATAKRLGASVTAYDVRKAAGDDVKSLGAKFLEVGVDAVGAGGYARELTEEEKKKEKELLDAAIISSDLIITTAGVPGKKAPTVISEEMISKMKPGSVIVDTMAEFGGNCALVQPGKIVDRNGVKIIGSINPQSEAPINASQMYSRNVLSFLSILIDNDGKFVDPAKDELLSACMICTDTKVTFPALQKGGEKR